VGAAVTRVLTVNAGSSSLKVSVVDDRGTAIVRTGVDAWDGKDASAITDAVERSGEVDLVAHRVVHGGTRFTAPVRIDDGVVDALRDLVPLDPLHQPRALLGIDATNRALPGLPSYACFDTAFHATLPAAASTYALPAAWRALGIRRFGFHGLSHAWASRRAAALVGRPPDSLRVVTCHLGSGSSLCAVAGGRSVDTTMGFTPLDGLVMATRPGAIDPGALLWLLTSGQVDVAGLADGLTWQSGLLALAGRSGDLRAIGAAADDGDEVATEAVEHWLHRLRAGIAAMAAAMDGLDVLVFTGGIGEHQPGMRARAADGLGFLGVDLDLDANHEAQGDAEISPPGAEVRTVVVTAREDAEMARQVLVIHG
jgi:acetate kinase